MQRELQPEKNQSRAGAHLLRAPGSPQDFLQERGCTWTCNPVVSAGRMAQVPVGTHLGPGASGSTGCSLSVDVPALNPAVTFQQYSPSPAAVFRCTALPGEILHLIFIWSSDAFQESQDMILTILLYKSSYSPEYRHLSISLLNQL